MGKTKKAIEKLSKKARAYCGFRQTEIRKYTASGQTGFVKEEMRKLRGYLQCLMDMECITYTDMQALYIFYGTM